ncbi:MAG: TetR/AcrR family transcriptional regulator [Hornefia sp.]|nr:TetR/AcrR family transcriptional regulator [Hornefia sp.]
MPERKGKRARSRMLILKAAGELFEEKGLKHVTFNDVAERAGMCRTTIFNYFTNINDILLALMDDEVKSILDFAETSRSEGNELIMDIFGKIIDDSAEFPVLAVKLVSVNNINNDAGRVFRKIEELIYNCLEDESHEKKERKTVVIMGIYYGLINHYLVSGEKLDARKIKREFREYVIPVFDI